MKKINYIRLGLGVVVLIAVFALGWEVAPALIVVAGVYEFINDKLEGEIKEVASERDRFEREKRAAYDRLAKKMRDE